jgi:hypothetical protein
MVLSNLISTGMLKHKTFTEFEPYVTMPEGAVLKLTGYLSHLTEGISV